METVLAIIRLRWTLTIAALRKSVWQTVGYVIAIVVGVGYAIGVGVVAALIGSNQIVNAAADNIGLSAYLSMIHLVVILLGSFVVIMVVFIQLMLIGDGSTMNTKRFSLYAIPDHRLQLGILLAGLSGIPSICGTLALLLWSMAYRWMGVWPVVVALIAAPVTIVTIMSLSKLILALATTLVTSKRGKAALYVVTMTVFIVAAQLPNMITGAFSEDSGFNVTGLSRVVTVLSWTPLGAAFQLPFDAFAGNAVALIGRIMLLVVTWMVCFAGCVWCIRHDRVTTGAADRTVTVKGIGAFAWMPDSVSGALSARLFTYLKRDPRQTMMFIMPVIFIVIFTIQSRSLDGESFVVWMGMMLGVWLMMMGEANGLSYDGRGFTMEVITGVRGFDDRVARARVFITIVVLYVLVLGVACFIVTGDWRTLTGLTYGGMSIGLAIGLACSSIGLAEIVNCVLMYPVPSMDKPFSTPQGRAVAQGFFPFVYLFGSLILMVPTGLVAIVLTVLGSETWDQWHWVLGLVGIINGLAMAAVGSWLSGKLLYARAINVVHTLDSFASLQR